jgi:hypothetical protein
MAVCCGYNMQMDVDNTFSLTPKEQNDAQHRTFWRMCAQGVIGFVEGTILGQGLVIFSPVLTKSDIPVLSNMQPHAEQFFRNNFFTIPLVTGVVCAGVSCITSRERIKNEVYADIMEERKNAPTSQITQPEYKAQKKEQAQEPARSA